MSNNARVVDGGEIGVAQWLQALAAGVEPDVRMNPVLLKPEADTRSQVVIDGRVAPEVTAMPWRERGPVLWPAMTAAFDALAAEHELVVLEGAGSPAEINLPDLVNNRMLAHADAAALLVSDIDRGGAFAHLYGTWALVPPATRDRLAGYVLNRFRGDAGAARARPGAAHRADRDGVRRRRADAAPRAARRGGRHRAGRPRPGRARRGDRAVPVRLQPRRVPPPRAGGVGARSSSTPPSWPAPTSSCCRAPSTSPPTWPGCASGAWRRRSSGSRRRGPGARHLRRVPGARPGDRRPRRRRGRPSRRRRRARPAAVHDRVRRRTRSRAGAT